MDVRFALMMLLSSTLISLSSLAMAASGDDCDRILRSPKERTQFVLGSFSGSYVEIFPHRLSTRFSVNGRQNKDVFEGARVWPNGTITPWKWTEFEIMAIAARFLSEDEFRAIVEVHRVAADETNSGEPAGVGNYTQAQLRAKLNLARKLLPGLDKGAINRP